MKMFERFQYDYKLSFDDTELLISEKELALFFEAINKEVSDPKLTSNWVTSEFLRLFNEMENQSWEKNPLSSENFASLLKMIKSQKISGKIAKEVFEEMWASGGSPEDIVEQKGLKLISDESAIQELIEKALKGNEEKITAYKNGKEKLFGFFVGQVMKLSQGQASPDVVNRLLKERLAK